GLWERHFARGSEAHDFFFPKDAVVVAALEPNAREEGGKGIVIRLPPFFIGMMVALRALDADAEKYLARRLRKLRRTPGYAIVVGGAVRVGAALRDDQLAHELVQRTVLAHRGMDPVRIGPHPLFAELLPVVAQQVAPL